MRYLITAFSLLVFHACWSQTSLPLPVEMPYNPDSLAAKRIAYILVKEYMDISYGAEPLVAGASDSITFNEDGTISERWQNGLIDTAYARIPDCDSLNAFHYTRCDSMGRVIESRSGSRSDHYRYNNKGDIVYAATVDRPAESAETVWIACTVYDSLNRPEYTYYRRGHLGYNWSAKSIDTTVNRSSYTRYIYENMLLKEVHHYLDSLTDPSTDSKTVYYYSGNRLVRVEVPRIREHKRKKKRVPFIAQMWVITYGYRE